MSRILLVICGGTIGSGYNDGQIEVQKTGAPAVLERYNNQYNNELVDFEIVKPFTKLSENMVAIDYERIYHAVINSDIKNFDGVIITCGTDTLAYTAAAMGLLLYHIGKPVVLVAANYPAGDSRSNAMHNFVDAVDFILGADFGGVFVSYQNNGVSAINLATRVTQFTHFTDRFLPASGISFGAICDGRFIKNEADENPDPKSFPKDFWAEGLGPKFSDEILNIKGVPSLDYQYFDFKNKKPKAVLHSLYHSSTACIEGENTSIIGLEKMCRAYDIPLYIAPYHTRELRYKTDNEMIKCGIIPIKDITEELALIKLMLAYGTFNNTEDIEAFLNKNIFFERICSL